MGTYCISDIHGHLVEFKSLIEKIKFSKDDTLYLLGDYVDQGEESMQLILYIIELQNQGYNINCLMGNHDLMMLKHLTKSYKFIDKTIEVFGNWKINGGENTLADWESLSDSKKETIYNWLNSLNFVVEDLAIGNRHFYLSHAYPVIHDVIALLMGYKNKEDMAVWYRLSKNGNPFKFMRDTEDKILVYGHTPTSYYLEENNKLRIFKDIGHNKICIDCGGKGLTREQNKDISRLAALRLEDLEEFYISSRLTAK